jgi:hypothetical protein
MTPRRTAKTETSTGSIAREPIGPQYQVQQRQYVRGFWQAQVIVIGNTTVGTVDLSGWKIVDQNNAAEPLAGVTLPAGASASVHLSGKGAQLSNKGDT